MLTSFGQSENSTRRGYFICYTGSRDDLVVGFGTKHRTLPVSKRGTKQLLKKARADKINTVREKKINKNKEEEIKMNKTILGGGGRGLYPRLSQKNNFESPLMKNFNPSAAKNV